MYNRDFDEFVKRQHQPPPEIAAIDWEKERDEWLQHLKQLYTLVESFIAEYISAGQIQKEYRIIEMTEEYIGSYKAQEMVLKVGRQELHLEPIGRLIFRAKGRVDVVAPAGRAQLWLVDNDAKRPSDLIHINISIGKDRPRKVEQSEKQTTLAWKMVTPPPDRRLINLDPEAFFHLIMELANG